MALYTKKKQTNKGSKREKCCESCKIKEGRKKKGNERERKLFFSYYGCIDQQQQHGLFHKAPRSIVLEVLHVLLEVS